MTAAKARPVKHRWKSKATRASAAAKLRARGLSTGRIAAELQVTRETIRTDLQRWDADHANVIPLPNRTAKSTPQTGPNLAPRFGTSELRRSEA